MLIKLKFFGVFLFVVFMYVFWDLFILGILFVGYIILMVILWILVFSMICIGLKEIVDKKLELIYCKEKFIFF